MALSAQSLNRAQDTPIATLKVMEIAPKDWHKFPPRIAPSNPVHVPTVGYTGGVQYQGAGQGINGEQGTINATNDWVPKTQSEKASLLGVPMARDVGAPNGWIEPREPYGPMPASPAGDPTVSAIAPTTAAAASLPLMVTITGTGFTPFSQVFTGGMSVPEAKAQYVSPTQMKVPIWAASPGNVTVAVRDHGVLSGTQTFVVT